MIKKGDIVSVYWETSDCEFKVEVLYAPGQAGDHWTFKRKDGTIINVFSYSKIVRLTEDNQ